MHNATRLRRRGRLSESLFPQIQKLESRELFAAHVANDPTVYATIQAAVNAAAAGATVIVDAGTYAERVTVDKPLTLEGARAGVDARDASRGQSESIVRGQDTAAGRSTSFVISADGVT